MCFTTADLGKHDGMRYVSTSGGGLGWWIRYEREERDVVGEKKSLVRALSSSASSVMHGIVTTQNRGGKKPLDAKKEKNGKK